MRSQIETAAGGSEPPGGLEAAMDRLFGEGVRPLRLEDAVFAAMLDGWERQQRSRMSCFGLSNALLRRAGC